MPTHPSHHDHDDGPTGTTRTRLPDSGSSLTRRPARTSRPLVTVVGVIVILVAALAFATRHSSSGGSSAGTDPDTVSGSHGGSAEGKPGHAEPTAPTGTLPVKNHAAGIPTGYPHTPQGAESAATNYAVALGGDGMFNTPHRHQIVSTVADPSALDKLDAGFDADYSAAFLTRVGLKQDGSAPAGETFVNRTIPAGAKAISYDPNTTKVSVWCMGLFGLAGNASTKPVTSGWFTVTFTLKWNGSDWKALEAAQSKGPTPVTGDDQVSSADAIAEAVKGYGGFTYAR